MSQFSRSLPKANRRGVNAKNTDTRMNKAKQRKQQGAQFRLETLESRQLLAVDVSTISTGLSSYLDTLKAPFQAAQAIDLSKFKVIASSFNDAVNKLDEVITQLDAVAHSIAQNNSINTLAGTALANALTGQTFGSSPFAITVSNASFNSADDSISLAISASGTMDAKVESSKGFEIGGFKFDLTKPFQVDLNNSYTIATTLNINGKGNVTFNAADSSIVYAPTFGGSAAFAGKIAGQIDFNGSITAGFGSLVPVTFGSGGYQPLTALSSALHVGPLSNTNLKVTPSIGVTGSSFLPDLNYATTFSIDVTSGMVTGGDNGQVTVGGQPVGAGDSISDLFLQQTLTKIAGPLFKNFSGLIPADVANFLEGDTVVFGSSLKSLLGKKPLTLIGDFVSGVVDGISGAGGIVDTVVTFLDDIIQVSQFADKVTNAGSADPSTAKSVKSDAKDLGVTFPILDNPVQSIIQILQGNNVKLVDWSLNLVPILEKVLKDKYSVPDQIIDKIETNIVKTDPDGVKRFNIPIKYVNITDEITKSAPSEVQNILKELQTVPGLQPPTVIFGGSFTFRANFTVGVDTNFLTKGGGFNSLLDSLYINPNQIIDLQSDLHVKTNFHLGTDLTDNAQMGTNLTFGNVVNIPAVAKTANAIVQNPKDEGGKVLNHFSDVGSDILKNGIQASLSGDISGGVSLNIMNRKGAAAQNPDGSPAMLEFSDLGYILNSCGITGLLNVKANLVASLTASGSVAGFSGSFGPKQYTLINVDQGSCATLTSPGDNSAPSISTNEPPPFMELINGILTVYGTSANDIITIDQDASGNLIITRNGRPLSQKATDVSSILVSLDGTVKPVDPNITNDAGGNDSFTISKNVFFSISITVHGGNGDDIFHANDDSGYFQGPVYFYGGGGNDLLTGSGGPSYLAGGDGNDTIHAGPGQVTILGGAGDDILSGMLDGTGITQSPKGGVIIGGSGNDIVDVGLVSRGNFTVVGGGTSNETAGDDYLQGGYGNDLLIGGDAILANGAYTPVLNTGGQDRIMGGPGDDTIYGGDTSCFLIGGSAFSTVDAGHNVIYGGTSQDYIIAGNATASSVGQPYLPNYTSAGSARVEGGSGDDAIFGALGEDTLIGGPGNDIISGGPGNDTIDGGEGADVITGGGGNDTLLGGDGSDVFLWTAGDGTDYVEGGSGQNSLGMTGVTDQPNSFTVSSVGTLVQASLAGTAGASEIVSTADIQIFSLVGSGQSDTFEIGSLDHTPVQVVEIGTKNAPTATQSPNQADTVIVHGSNAADSVTVTKVGNSQTNVEGLSAKLVVEGLALSDVLNLKMGAGNDSVRVYGEPSDGSVAVPMQFQIEGGLGNDTLEYVTPSTGPVGDKVILMGNQGNDTLTGGDGPATLLGGAGSDTIIGGAGNDTIYGDGEATGVGANFMILTVDPVGGGNDTIFGGAGNDTIYGGAGNDKIDGGDGDDTIYGFAGYDNIQGGAGNDTIDGGDGNDQIDGGAGDDTIYGSAGTDNIQGGAGNDTIDGGDGNDQIDGGAGDDTIYGSAGTDNIQGGAGNDTIDGGDGNDVLFGGAGNDLITGGAGDDQIWGDDGNDLLQGGTGNDLMIGGAGNDSLQGGDGNDVLFGGADNDVLQGEAGNDALYGGAGNDWLYGGTRDTSTIVTRKYPPATPSDGDDLLSGGGGRDHLDGGNGNNLMDAGNDNIQEVLYAGPGNDYVFTHKQVCKPGQRDIAVIDGGRNHVDQKVPGGITEPAIPTETGERVVFVTPALPTRQKNPIQPGHVLKASVSAGSTVNTAMVATTTTPAKSNAKAPVVKIVKAQAKVGQSPISNHLALVHQVSRRAKVTPVASGR